MTTLTIGTYNVWHKASRVRFERDVAALLRTNADVFALQEVRSSWRRKILSELPGWDVYQPEGKRAQVDPIIWRKSRFLLLDKGSERVARGSVLAGWGGSVPPRYANWVRLYDRVTGSKVVVVSTHLHASIERKGKPRRLRRTRQAYGHIRALRRFAAGVCDCDEVFIAGDFNIDWDADRRVRHRKFPFRVLYKGGHPHLVPCWAWSRAKGGTHGRKGRKIDYVWHRRSEAVQSVKARILRDGYHSDHHPVLATYNISTSKEN